MDEPLTELLSRFDAAMDRSDLHTACDLLSEVRALTGDTPDVLAAHGHLLLSLGRVAPSEDAAWKSIGIEPDHAETLRLLGRLYVQTKKLQTGPNILPGSSFAKVYLPLDYPPSRRLTQRWGYGAPPHGRLVELFAQRRSEYLSVINELRTLVPSFRQIRQDYSVETAPEPGWVGPPVNALDLALLYYFVWKHRPSTYVEIGSGATTCFARRAVSDHQLKTRIVSIDPEPRSAIDRICDQVVRDGLETLPDLQIFSALSPGDIVFMDGSHRCFMNSDVTVFFMDVLPLLKPGVIVHIHDIALPQDYPEWSKHWYWNEQYMLAAYLLGKGDGVRLLMPGQYVSCTPGLKETLHPPLLPDVGPEGIWTDSGSFWFTHV